jgi:FkbM family methyltransferase
MRRTATGFYYRPSDKTILDEVPGVYGNVPVEHGDTVLDLGAHIGTASALFLSKGAGHVVAVDADPTNIPFLRRNLPPRRSTILWAAVADDAVRIPFYPRPDRTWVGSVVPDRDRKAIVVPAVPLAGLLKRYRPRVLKVDIEFSEYLLRDLRALPPAVRVVAIELTIRFIGIFTGRTMDADELRERREAAAELMACFEGQGFTELWRKDKQAKVGEPPAAPDASGLGPMTKCVCVTYVR